MASGRLTDRKPAIGFGIESEGKRAKRYGHAPPFHDRDHQQRPVPHWARGRAEEVVDAVDPWGIGIRYGHFHAQRLIEDLGLTPQTGVVRVSMVHYNTEDEVDRLIAALDSTL